MITGVSPCLLAFIGLDLKTILTTLRVRLNVIIDGAQNVCHEAIELYTEVDSRNKFLLRNPRTECTTLLVDFLSGAFRTTKNSTQKARPISLQKDITLKGK